MGIIQDIKDNAEEQRIGDWREKTDEVVFHIKGSDVVTTDQVGEFITILKGCITNERVKNARNKKV